MKLHMIFMVLFSTVLSGYEVEAHFYNHSSTIECLKDPLVPQYGGGMLSNPEFNKGLEGWDSKFNGVLQIEKSNSGNQYIVAAQRTRLNESFSQRVYLQDGLLYAFSAWVQMGEGKDIVVASLRVLLSQKKVIIGSVVAQSSCWKMFKGGLSSNMSTLADLIFETNNTGADLWVDSVSLQPFTKDEWRAQQLERTEKARKRNLRLVVTNKLGQRLSGVEITIQQTKRHFPLGCAITETILFDEAYQNWFKARNWSVTVFNNEMKWSWTEEEKGKVNYTTADALVAFAKENGVAVRGHNVLWDEKIKNPEWTQRLDKSKIGPAATKRLNSVMSRYRGQIINWDVMNENLHYSFYEDNLGPNASALFYKLAQEADPGSVMFLNEYNTIEEAQDMWSSPSRMIEKLENIRSFPGNGDMVVGFGLEAHFSDPALPYMRASLDTLGETKMPIWLTEMDVFDNKREALEDVMREAFSHPAVEGIVIWAGFHPKPSNPSGLQAVSLFYNGTYMNSPTGDLVDDLIEEWKTSDVKGKTDTHGTFEYNVFHGDYDVMVSSPYNDIVCRRQVVVTKAPETYVVQITL